MKLTKVIPQVFYSDINVGLRLFVECLGFKIVHADKPPQRPFYIIERDGVTLLLVEDAVFAEKDRPQLRLETDDIETLHAEIKSKKMGLFHPNLPEVKEQPWGLKEFGLLDESDVCVVIQQQGQQK
jgi:hypothetical protein